MQKYKSIIFVLGTSKYQDNMNGAFYAKYGQDQYIGANWTSSNDERNISPKGKHSIYIKSGSKISLLTKSMACSNTGKSSN